ncbi:OmpA family protein [Pseudorhodoplanes sinuspersici]|nr:OmpA family protein [Pseudorhodoplanes sinuspersici]RKE72186.1 outer membrane protein OmpA-like peptidoglycan-associated protein [Pseudorhodoplanes sinuspersici]
MSQFDTIIDDVAGRFGLDGAKASTLLRELLKYMTTSPGGIGGFIDKFKTAGLSHEANKWLGKADAAPLTSSQVEQAMGSSTIDMIARKVGIPGGVAAAALGYLTPKVVGKLTPNGVIGSGIPSAVSDFIRTSPSMPAYDLDEAMPYGTAAARQPASSGRWVAPLLGLLALAGLGWYLFSHRAPDQVATAPAPQPAATTSGSGTATAPSAATPSRLTLRNDNGVVTVAGTVRDQATRQSILDTLKKTFGDNAIKGDIAVNANAAPTPWLANLPAALAQMKTPGIQASFEDRTINLAGLNDAERDRIMNSLKSLFGPLGMSLAATDPLMGLISDANNKVTTALAGLGSQFQTKDLLNILNNSIINFPTASAEIPEAGRALLQRAAGPFKQLPAGTVIQISGYTDNTGDPAKNLELSQHRADAVKNALIQSGVNPAMLVAKGYGSADPIASNDTEEGRFKNRRISYQVSDQNRATTGSGK